jgi:hypothetical protein
MKATKTPGNVVVTLEMSDEEFALFTRSYHASSSQSAYNSLGSIEWEFYKTARQLVKAILYGGQEEIVG